MISALPYVAIAELEIDLRGVQICMAKQQLNPADICPGPDEVNGKAVPECAGMNVNVDHPAVLLDRGVRLTSFYLFQSNTDPTVS
jgi:hypothetical protein